MRAKPKGRSLDSLVRVVLHSDEPESELVRKRRPWERDDERLLDEDDRDDEDDDDRDEGIVYSPVGSCIPMQLMVW